MIQRSWIVFAILLGKCVSPAAAQTYDDARARRLILAGGSTDITHLLTIQAPTLTGSSSLTLPAANASGGLINDGTGILSWSAIVTNPMTTLGDMISGGASGAAVRLAGQTTIARAFLTQTESGGTPAAPGWFDLFGTANTFSALQTGTAGLTITGATVSLNASSNFNTNINTGTSTGAIGIGNSAATGITANVGTGNFSLDGTTGSTYTIGASTTTGTMTIGGTAETGTMTLGSSSGTNTLNIANGAGATTLNLANVQTAGAVNIGAGMTTGTITIGGTGLQTGTIGIGTGTGAQTINLGTGGTGVKTVNIATGSVADLVTIGSSSVAVGVGTAPTSNMLTVNGNIQMANSTNNKITTNNTDLVLEQTGDTYGTTRLHIQNRNGSNSALFEQAGTVNLCDFGFKPGTGAQSNLRLEARAGTIRNTANNAVGEFEFFMGTTTTPVYNFETGEGATAFELGNVGIGMVNPTQKLQVQDGDVLLSNSAGNPDTLSFQGTSTGVSGFRAGAQGSTNIYYTLPTAAPTANGSVLQSTTAGTMSWVAPPTYVQTAAGSGLSPTGANTTEKMMGMGSTFTYTPTVSTNALIIMTGTLNNNTGDDGATVQMRYGTGSAPANQATPLVGTAVGAKFSGEATTSGSGGTIPHLPFSCTAIVTGLTLNTAIWIDASVAAVTGGTGTITGVIISVVPLPQ